ncbi:MAG TPA: SpoIIE family protein phosphatase [Candidatus Angelobacter sp.]
MAPVPTTVDTEIRLAQPSPQEWAQKTRIPPEKSRFSALLLPLALIFAGATVIYSAVWMYYIRLQPKVEIGIATQILSSGAEVIDLAPDGPAQQAGLRLHDLIIAVDGKRLDNSAQNATQNALTPAWIKSRPGDLVALSVLRPGVSQPLVISATFRARPGVEPTLVRRIAEQIISVYPIFFLVIGVAVLFMRLDDPNAWLLALLFAGFIAASDFPNSFVVLPHGLRAFMVGYRALFVGMIAPLFYFFFAIFPECSPINARMPRLKWILLLLGVSFGFCGFRAGNPELWPGLQTVLGPKLARWSILTFIYGTVLLGLASLASNMRVALPEARRKLRIIVFGTVAGVGPVVVVHAIGDFRQVGPPFWLDFTTIVLLWLFPLSFAYAVVKHRVLEIPVLLKRSARYLFVLRGLAVFVALLAASLIAVFTVMFSVFFPIGSKAAMAIGVVFGITLTSASTPGLKKVTHRIDRAFFRGAYDARLILQDLAQKAPRFNTRKDLAAELAARVDEALHPTWLAVYVEAPPDYLESEAEKLPATSRRFPKSSSFLEHLDRSGEPWDTYADPVSAATLSSTFAPLQPECLVGFPARSGELLGLLVLGSRLSEEPYSGEDKMLLHSVASQAGVALENLRLAENIAERLEAERNALREMEIARQVQSKLFPQSVPQLKTLEIAGTCRQTRAVGGDYYDFVELGPGHLGLVVADVAGKGISAALLMANLQANLRSQYALALEDLPLLLKRVNRLFYENTEPSHYTTMFFGCYDDDSRRLVYANCGHCPPLLVRNNGSTQQLSSTATVLGLFPEWECEISEVRLEPRDILVLYSDGVTEAANDHDEEFGESRMMQTLQSANSAPASALLSRLLDAVGQFSAGKQSDDVTVIIARAR